MKARTVLGPLACALAAVAFLGACASAPRSGAAAHGGKSLYVRLGGLPAITAVVHASLQRILKDSRVKDYFADSDLGVLEKHFIQLTCAASGGPCPYQGHGMREAHERLHITNAAFDAVVEDIFFTMRKFKVGGDEQDEVIAILNAQRKDIVEVK
jgi:hemoglobin